MARELTKLGQGGSDAGERCEGLRQARQERCRRRRGDLRGGSASRAMRKHLAWSLGLYCVGASSASDCPAADFPAAGSECCCSPDQPLATLNRSRGPPLKIQPKNIEEAHSSLARVDGQAVAIIHPSLSAARGVLFGRAPHREAPGGQASR
jgi:hypothetical protein